MDKGTAPWQYRGERTPAIKRHAWDQPDPDPDTGPLQDHGKSAQTG